MRIPTSVVDNCRKSPERMTWLERLPDVLEKLLRQWELTLDGENPSCAYVVAVRCANGTQAVLKVGMPHMEQEHEIRGLRFWGGDPTVRLFKSGEELGAMLLERCWPGTTLRLLL
jgi:streptomycin 6-kinase